VVWCELDAAVVRELLNRESLLGAISARAICRDRLPQRAIVSDVAAVTTAGFGLKSGTGTCTCTCSVSKYGCLLQHTACFAIACNQHYSLHIWYIQRTTLYKTNSVHTFHLLLLRLLLLGLLRPRCDKIHQLPVFDNHNIPSLGYLRIGRMRLAPCTSPQSSS
jgi:hypothetical protein